ncbi:MAG TPA: ABC transporter permease [Pararhizobium sp.]|nr:ABC transporter permease [Pararhizobium sp.]
MTAFAWRRYGRALAGRPGGVRRPAAFLIVICIIASFVAPAFLTVNNLVALLTSSSFLVVAAVGESFVVMVGMIDLGLESMLAAAGMFIAWQTVFHGVPGPLAVFFTLVAGAGVGLLAGLLVARGGIPSFIVTLATYWGIRGVALLFNGGNYISPYSVTPPHPFGFSGISGTIGGFPVLILISLVVVIAGQLVMSLTPLGNWIRASGSNENAARAVGIRTNMIKILVLAISGFMAALAGIMITSWQDSIYPLTGEGDSLQAIAGVILGGIPFNGGRGTIIGAALGVLVIGVINDVIVLIGLPALYQYIFVAAILILAGLQARMASAK